MLRQHLELITFHIGTHDATADKVLNVFTNLILLKKDNEKNLPESKVFVSSFTKKTKPWNLRLRFENFE